ncbi:MAG: ferritin family protein [Candidatus Thermoplasmatota archaeon]|nr:ferritin family protein [Candidatus Thermoplasmatota archaeon]
MDLDNYSLEELLLAAIKSEVESKDVYTRLAGKVDNAYLSDKLIFMAGEEQKHRDFLESVYRMKFRKDATLPVRSPVPLPEVNVKPGMVMASEVILQAMAAEKAASEFYGYMAGKHEFDDETKKTLNYLSSMEMGHYRLLELEKEQLNQQEEYEFEWEMMHAGP